MSAAVIALPTAAPAKVRQQRSRTRAADRDALLRFPTLPTAAERAAEERRELAMAADLPSLVLILRAMGLVLDTSQQRRMAMFLALSVEHEGGAEACAWWQHFVCDPCGTYGEGR